MKQDAFWIKFYKIANSKLRINYFTILLIATLVIVLTHRLLNNV